MRIAPLVILTTWALANLGAQNEPPVGGDPPARVARMNYVSGSVSFQPAGVEEWVAAPLNRPLTTGDQFWTDDQSRAEMHIGSTGVRVAGLTGFSFLNLDDITAQLRLTQGIMVINVADLGEHEVIEVDTPNTSFTVIRPGVYRIEVDPAGQTTMITVRRGEGEAIGGQQTVPIRQRDRVRLAGLDRPVIDVSSAPSADDFDAWCQDRDRREMQSVSAARYVSREMIGYEDLDQHGTWNEAPEYGAVWYPRSVPAGWAPYRYGHWAWIEPWGWTWVDDAPWGFAPFHYGRWAYISGAWGWVPGPRVRRPVYAPALVAWVGGPRASISIGIGGGGVGVGWFPLGPGEVYVPSHRASSGYFNNVNVSNTRVTNVQVTNVYNTTVVNNNTSVINNTRYVNRGAPGGVTAVSQDTFSRGRSVSQGMANVNSAALQSAPVTTNSAIAPSRQSVLGSSMAARNTPPAAVSERQVVARTPPPAGPAPFSSRREAYQANPGQPVGQDQTQQQRPARSLVRQSSMPPRTDTGAASTPATQPSPAERQGRSGFPRVQDRSTPAPAATPVQTPAPVERQRPVERATPVERTAPVERPRVDRPVTLPAEQPRVDRPRVERPQVERPPVVERPQVERQRVERPAETKAPEQRRQERQEQKRKEKKEQ